MLEDRRTIVIMEDITAEVTVQARLQRSEERLRLILDTLQVGIAVIRIQDRRITYANPALMAMIGHSAEELLGARCQEYICHGCMDDCPFLDRNICIAGAEITLRNIDDTPLHILKSIVATEINGEPALVESFVDITPLKHVQEELHAAKNAAEMASKAKSAFLTIMSHEIRTPLNGIQGTLEILHEMDVPGMEELLTMALASSRGLVIILQDVLDLAAMESGTFAIQNQPFPTRHMFEPVLNAFVEEATRKNISLEWQIDAALPQTICSDVQRIRQVLFNLVGNAVKYTDHGGVRLEITMLPYAPAGHQYVHMAVYDTGSGISDEQLSIIFDPFTQTDMALHRHRGGVGIGLAIVKRLLHLMNSRLCLISEPGQGSEFHFSLPLVATCTEATFEENS